MNYLLNIAFILLLLCSIVLADDMATDPCPNDIVGYCMNSKAIEYVNILRRQKGRTALGSGSLYMFDNAMDHSKVQDRAKDIFHQPIESGVQVGQGECLVTLSGENVAFYSNSRFKNAAMYCVMDLWKNSLGHYNNMMTASHKNTVIAIYRSNGRVTCTQTFSGKPLVGTGKCSAALPANGVNSPVEQLEDLNVIAEQSEEAPTTKTDPPVTRKPPVAREIPRTREITMNHQPSMMQQTSGTQQTLRNRKTLMKSEGKMKEGNQMRRGRKKMKRMEAGFPSRNMKENYIILNLNGKRTKFVKRKFNRRYYICNPDTGRCFGRRTSMKIMRVFMYLAQ